MSQKASYVKRYTDQKRVTTLENRLLDKTNCERLKPIVRHTLLLGITEIWRAWTKPHESLRERGEKATGTKRATGNLKCWRGDKCSQNLLAIYR